MQDPKRTPNTKPVATLEISFAIPFTELTLDHELGRGGFGIVLQGTWRHHDVAVKRLQMDKLSDDAQEEFQQEMRIMAHLRSPNIVSFYGFSVDRAPYCIVMEYLAKGDLYNVLHSKQPLSWEQRSQIALDIARGLAYLHKENIMHRDLKSKNILLDNNYQAKLADFGLSKVKTETKTTTTSANVGTLAWTAPELFKRRAQYTLKADIYSYGIVLWELSARKRPFEDAKGNQTLIKEWVSEGERDEVPADTPEKMAELMQLCWAQDPNVRPTADEAIARLKAATLTPPVSPSLGANDRVLTQPHYDTRLESVNPTPRYDTRLVSANPQPQSRVATAPKTTANDPVKQLQQLLGAIQWDDLEQVKQLTPVVGVNVQHPTTGMTPLGQAAIHGSKEAVQYLLAAHADTRQRVRNQTPEELAEANGRLDIALLINPSRSQRPPAPAVPRPQPIQPNVETPKPKTTPEQPIKLAPSKASFFSPPPKKTLSQQEQQRQDEFIKVMLTGNLVEAKKRYEQGASLTDADSKGMYPLVAAAYSANWALVSYVEDKLGAEAKRYWSDVDGDDLGRRIDSEKPEKRPQNATYGWLGAWYGKVKNKLWFRGAKHGGIKGYEERMHELEKMYGWYDVREQIWEIWKQNEVGDEGLIWEEIAGIMDSSSPVMVDEFDPMTAPTPSNHDEYVKTLTEQLDTLKTHCLEQIADAKKGIRLA